MSAVVLRSEALGNMGAKPEQKPLLSGCGGILSPQVEHDGVIHAPARTIEGNLLIFANTNNVKRTQWRISDENEPARFF